MKVDEILKLKKSKLSNIQILSLLKEDIFQSRKKQESNNGGNNNDSDSSKSQNYHEKE
ncbi:hypothetical protein [Halanaerobium saccharolyticum]|uniref:hypothetical protein n=1 Tax=Halanaerobium saccharolyticum TaxID=43595 RepID=UPI0015E6CF5C|nr:hypothetical protein [Halanaerobium saccharolyticum]